MSFRHTRRTVLRTSLAAAASLAAPAILRPALAQGKTPLSFQLDWKFNAQFAGLFVAQAQGLYDAADLDVTIREWNNDIRVLDAVSSGEMDMGCAEQSLIVAAQAAGAPVKAVATMFQASPYGLMTLPETDMDELGDLVGHAVGVHDDGAKVMALVKSANGIAVEDIELREIPYADKFALVTSGQLKTVQCYVIDEPIGVAKQFGFEPKIMHMRDHGFVSTAQTIMVRDDVLAEKPEAVRAFLAATFEGWARTLADKPAAAATVVADFVPDGSVYKDIAYQTRTLELLEDYVLGVDRSAKMGVIDAERWDQMGAEMAKFGIIAAAVSREQSLALDFYS